MGEAAALQRGMARTAVTRNLPPLPKVVRWRKGENKGERVLEILREIALRLQTNEPQCFYSLRQVERHFHIALSTTAKVFSHLQEEGLLSRLRGSRTRLEGRQSFRAVTVRGVIGLPASLSQVILSEDYRRFLTQVPRALRLRGFVAQVVYFEANDLRTGDLSERLKRFQTDTVIWFAPEAGAQDAIARLREAGIRVLGIGDGGLPPIPCAFEIERRRAELELLRNWRAEGEVNRVVVISVKGRRGAEERLSAIFDESGWDCEFLRLDQVRPGFLPASSNVGVFLSAGAAWLLSCRAPELLAGLLASCRVAFFEGPIVVPFASPPTRGRADLIEVNWAELARQIAEPLALGIKKSDAPLVFEACLKTRVPAAECMLAL